MNPFVEWLDEVASDSIVVSPHDTTSEARGNLWTFGLNEEQRILLTQQDVEEFVRAVVAARADWLRRREFGPMQFYSWYDAQAGQLRFSMISGSDTKLPFEIEVNRIPELSAIVQEFLSVAGSPLPFPLPVWSVVVP